MQAAISENAAEGMAAGRKARDIPTVAVVRVLRGFSCLFWSIPLGLLLFSSQAAGIRGALSLRPISGFRLPTYVLATLLMYAGVLYLHRAGPLTRSWSRYVRRTLFVVFLQVYFAPFYHWWDRMPHETFFMLNVLGLLLSAIWALYLINQLAGLTGLVLDDDTFYIEAKLCGWAVVALMAFPFLAMVLYGVQATLRFKSSLYMELLQAQQQIPGWIYALFLLPFFLTMAACWKARAACMRYLEKRDRLEAATETAKPPPLPETPAPADRAENPAVEPMNL